MGLNWAIHVRPIWAPPAQMGLKWACTRDPTMVTQMAFKWALKESYVSPKWEIHARPIGAPPAQRGLKWVCTQDPAVDAQMGFKWDL